MNSADLTREQVNKLLAEIELMLGYLSRLSAPIDQRGMGTDPLAADVRKAQAAIQSLRMRLHYLHYEGLGDRANQRSR